MTQSLFSASLIAEVLPTLWESDQAEGRQLLGELRQLTRGALAEMRTLLLELRPAALVEANLGDLLRQLAESVSGRTGIPVTVAMEGPLLLNGAVPDLPDEVHIALYQIAQEALNNVVKHARAQRADVQLSCLTTCEEGEEELALANQMRIELSISDDGQGFDPATVSPDHLGLGIIRERSQAIGASLSFNSQPGMGTVIEVIWNSGGRMTPTPIGVLVVDDHAMVRRGLAAFLRAKPDLALVGEAPGGEEAITLCERLHPDVVLMDLMMPGMSGAEATRAIRSRWPETQVIALTSFGEKEMVREALAAGALSYLLKNVSAEDLAQAIRAACGGRSTLAPEAVQALVQPEPATAEPDEPLTAREHEVLVLMVKGMTNPQIAEHLVVSRATAKAHVSNVLAKLGVSNRAEAVAVALQKRLV